MDFWIPMAFTVLLEVLAEKGKATKFAARFAKVYVKLENLAKTTPALADAIESQRAKEGGK